MSEFETAFELVLAAYQRRYAPEPDPQTEYIGDALARSTAEDCREWITTREIATKHGISIGAALKRCMRMPDGLLERRIRQRPYIGGPTYEWKVKGVAEEAVRPVSQGSAYRESFVLPQVHAEIHDR